MLSNLLHNAFKFTEKGEITFGFNVNEEKIIFHVKDSGIGIPKEKLEEIFERFKQVNYDNNAKLGGTGLGLAICKGIVEMLGGSISVQSVLGVGTEFVFTIPFIESLSANITTEEYESKILNLATKTILIAEDDEIVQLYFKEILKSTNVKLLFAENGEKAVELYSRNPVIDLVLMDIRMPVMNGFEAIDKIFKIDPKAIIVAQTAYVMSDEKEKCFSKGCKDYLSKPINKEILLKVLEKWID